MFRGQIKEDGNKRGVKGIKATSVWFIENSVPSELLEVICSPNQ